MKIYSFGPFELDLRLGVLRKNGQEISIEPRVFGLLAYLVENAGRVIPRDELLDKNWPDAHVTDGSVSQAIASLREALDDDARDPTYIATMSRRGYKFVGNVSAKGGATYHILNGTRDFILGPGENVIGRGGDAAIRVHSDEVSRHHARVIISSTGARIEDLQSRNGTFVQGRRIERSCQLEHGDIIVVGNVTLRFQISSGTRSTATVPLRDR